PEARRDGLGDGIDGHQAQGLDLVGGAHQGELGGDRGAGAADEQQGGEHRREFAVQAQADQHADLVGGAVGLQRAVAEQGQRQADEGAADGDDGQRARADLVDLAQQLGEEIGGGPGGAEHRQREQAGAAQRAGAGDEGHQRGSPVGACTDAAAGEVRAAEAGSKAIGPSGSPRRNWRSRGSSLASSSAGVPAKTMPRLAVTSTWSAIGRVSRTWWLTMMLVSPSVALRREIRLMMTPEAIGSSPVSGSS